MKKRREEDIRGKRRAGQSKRRENQQYANIKERGENQVKRI